MSDDLPTWPPDAIEAIVCRLHVEVNGGKLEHIATLYTREGQAIIVLDALAQRGFDVRDLVEVGRLTAERDQALERWADECDKLEGLIIDKDAEIDLLREQNDGLALAVRRGAHNRMGAENDGQTNQA